MKNKELNKNRRSKKFYFFISGIIGALFTWLFYGLMYLINLLFLKFGFEKDFIFYSSNSIMEKIFLTSSSFNIIKIFCSDSPGIGSCMGYVWIVPLVPMFFYAIIGVLIGYIVWRINKK